jgi:hypothetical protein
MRLRAALLVAILLAAPAAARAGSVADFLYAPRFVGKLAAYGFEFDPLGTSKNKLATIARGCPTRQRGVVMKATVDDTLAFGQAFPDPNQKRAPAAAFLLIDPTKLGPGERAAVELDSPFVPIGGQVDAFVIKLQALPESDARADALKRLAKATKKDESAIEKIDKGDLDKAKKRVADAVDSKLRAKAVLETGVVAEGKGAL